MAASSSTFVGAKIQVTSAEDSYEGIVHSIDVQKRRLTLTQVTLCSSGKRLHGFHNFFGDELNNLAILETAESMKSKKENGKISNLAKTSEVKVEKSTGSSGENNEVPHQRLTESNNAASGPNGITSNTTATSSGNRLNAGSRSDGMQKSAGNSKPQANQSSRKEASVANMGNERVAQVLFGRAMKAAGISVKQTRPASGHVTRDASDEGSSMLFRPPLDTEKYLMDDFSDEDDSSALSPHRPPQTVIIKEFSDRFRNAIQYILKQRVVGVSCEGVNLSRYGKICLVVVGCRQFVYLFDVLGLGAPCFDEGLQEVMENGNILKVFHDCRHASDAFYHQFSVRLINVFDTQVADIIIHKKEQGGELPRVVSGLVPCLYEYLNLSSDCLSFQKFRLNQMKMDEAVWSRRPLPERLIDAAAKRVMYLRELRLAQMERMMAEYIHGVNIYLKIYRDSKDHLRGKNADKSGRVLPQEFKQELGQFDHQKRYRRYDHQDFADDLEKGPAAEIPAGRSDLWSEGEHFNNKYRDRHGNLREHTLNLHLSATAKSRSDSLDSRGSGRSSGGSIGAESRERHEESARNNWNGPNGVGITDNKREAIRVSEGRSDSGSSGAESREHHAEPSRNYRNGPNGVGTMDINGGALPVSKYKSEDKANNNSVPENGSERRGKDFYQLGPPGIHDDDDGDGDYDGDDLSDFDALNEDFSDDEGKNVFQFKLTGDLMPGNTPVEYESSATSRANSQTRPKGESYERDVNDFNRKYRTDTKSINPKKQQIPQSIFQEEDFPPLSSSDNESIHGTPPRRNMPMTTHNARPPGIGHGARARYDQRSTPPPQAQMPLSSESAVLGRGRALLYQRLAGMPKARLPNLDEPVHIPQGTRTYRDLSTKERVSFPSDDELMATPVVANVANPNAVGGTRVRIRKI